MNDNAKSNISLLIIFLMIVHCLSTEDLIQIHTCVEDFIPLLLEKFCGLWNSTFHHFDCTRVYVQWNVLRK